MDVTPLIPAGRQIIQRYGAQGIQVSGENYPHAVIVMPGSTIAWPQGGEALNENSFDSLGLEEMDVVLLGTGAKAVFVDPALRALWKDKGLHVDVMDTGAACRTYNVLMPEGRRVAAALVPL